MTKWWVFSGKSPECKTRDKPPYASSPFDAPLFPDYNCPKAMKLACDKTNRR
jgi:hypothetical protein